MSPLATGTAYELDLPTWCGLVSRYHGALHALEETRRAFEEFPNDRTAGQVRWAESALLDAIALAGELQVPDLPWALS